MSGTVSMTLSEFLTARITEDGEAARRWVERIDTPHRWSDETLDPGLVGVIVNGRHEIMSEDEWRALYLEEVAPDRRVLAECEAKRQIVADHHPSGEYDPDSCVLCQWDIDCDSPKADYKDGAGEFPCPTLRYLAAVYADHPDYDEAWRP